MKILVIGVGGIGGFIGSYLVNSNYDVTFIARKKRLSYLMNYGLTNQSQLGNIYCPKIRAIEIIEELLSLNSCFNSFAFITTPFILVNLSKV